LFQVKGRDKGFRKRHIPEVVHRGRGKQFHNPVVFHNGQPLSLPFLKRSIEKSRLPQNKDGRDVKKEKRMFYSCDFKNIMSGCKHAKSYSIIHHTFRRNL